MKRCSPSFLIASTVVLLLLTDVSAQVPATMSVTSVLRDDGGEKLEGNFILTFRLYNVGEGETPPLWEESQGLEVRNGIVQTTLGSIEPLNLPFDEPYWLGIVVNNGEELAPRIAMTSSAYSMTSKYVADEAVVAGDNVTVARNESNQLVISAVGGSNEAPSPWMHIGSNIFYNAGKVGIGDRQPLATLTVGEGEKLQVHGDDGDIVFSDDEGSIRFPDVDGSSAPMIEMFSSSGGLASRMVVAHSGKLPDRGIQFNDTTDSFNFIAEGDPVLHVQVAGQERVGIGTFKPEAKLQINANSDAGRGQLKLTETESDHSRITFNNTESENWWDIAVRADDDPANSFVTFLFRNIGSVFSVRAMGTTGINKESPEWALDVDGKGRERSVNIENTLPARSTSTVNYGIVSELHQEVGGGFSHLIPIYGRATDSNASVNYGVYGRATSASNYNYGIYGSADTDNGYAGYFSGSTFSAASYVPSDAKLKIDIQPFQAGLTKVMALNPRISRYDTRAYKSMNLPEGLQYGLLAEEVKAVMPELVKTSFQPYDDPISDTPDGQGVEFEAVNYVALIPVLVSAIQEQQATIVSLQEELRAVRASISR